MLMVNAELLGIEGERKVKIKRADMRTKGQLRSFLCRRLELDDELTIEVQFFDPELGKYTALRSTTHLATGDVGKIRLARQAIVTAAAAPTRSSSSSGGKRKITAFVFMREALGIGVTSANSSLYISAVAPGGQGGQLGIRQGDVIIGVNGVPVEDCVGSHSTDVVDAFVSYLASMRRPLTLNMLLANEAQEVLLTPQTMHDSHTPQMPPMQQMVSQMLEQMQMMQDQIQDIKMKQIAETAKSTDMQLLQLRQQQGEQQAGGPQQRLHRRLNLQQPPSGSPMPHNFFFPFKCCNDQMSAEHPTGVQSLALAGKPTAHVPAYAPQGPRRF
jgi:hypothetical protein